ncbi:GAF and ANTAR domain-containing protein [Actinoplanes rectilineatus]|uniref:GAF and ANTAR domain-containing protein n=1 Tax=Actinoplanes rectilineatus TaxID=113571 RepID=UPI0005F2E3AC|nr:GAF and ANTAR domain-containing protein [Actinoplanes rectilineatus]
MTHVPGPSDALSALGHIRFSETSRDDFVGRVAALAVQLVPGAGEVSITLLGERGPFTAAATGDVASRLDERQYHARTGPCLDAAADRSTVSVPDTATDTRWGHWSSHAAAAGMGSVLSVGLTTAGTRGGSLNIYARPAAAFSAGATETAQAYAGYASVALDNARVFFDAVALAAQLREAMGSRAVIEQAKGVIIAQRRCTPDEAFAHLTKVSQDSNRKLRDVAATIVAGFARRTV